MVSIHTKSCTLASGLCCAATGQAGEISTNQMRQVLQHETHMLEVSTTPIERHLTARIGISHKRSLLCAEATVKVRIGGTLDGTDVADLTNDTGVGVSVRRIAYIRFAVDRDCIEEAVSVDGGCHHCEKECVKCCLHLAGRLLC